MPVIKSAIKKLRKDRKREVRNDEFRAQVDQAIKSVKKSKSADALKSAFSYVDKAAKKHLIHKNKAARIKSSLSKIITPTKAVPSK